MKNQETTLKEIWEAGYMNELPDWVKENKYCYSENTAQKDLLITGINPSCVGVNPVVFKFEESVRDGKLDSDYWRNMRKMVLDAPLGVDLRPRAAYLDIFYFRHSEQEAIRKELIGSAGWPAFAAAQLNLTQHTIEEVIKPKLIVIANKESYAYWGKEEKYVWMGYAFEKIKDTQYGELCTITGLRSSGRIAPELQDTQLKGKLALFSEYPAAGQPSAAFLQALLANA